MLMETLRLNKLISKYYIITYQLHIFHSYIIIVYIFQYTCVYQFRFPL